MRRQLIVSDDPKVPASYRSKDAIDFYLQTIQALEAPNFSVVTLDLPGMGKAADDPGPFSLDRFAQEVASVVDAVGRSTVLVGHSMGGQIAELVAGMRPRQIAGG